MPGGLKVDGSTEVIFHHLSHILSSVHAIFEVVGNLVTDRLTSGSRRLTLRGDRSDNLTFDK